MQIVSGYLYSPLQLWINSRTNQEKGKKNKNLNDYFNTGFLE